MRYLEARNILVGDSCWCWWSCALALRSDDVTVLCNTANIGVFEFFRDYLEGCEHLQMTTDSLPVSTKEMSGGPWNYEETYAFRREPMRQVDTGPYLCFQPESAAHNKRNPTFSTMECRRRGYSVGVAGERIVRGTLTFHGHSISEVAGLLYHSEGMVGIFSSMVLFASLLGKKVVVSTYSGLTINTKPTGFQRDRCRVVGTDGKTELESAVKEHFGDGWI